MYLGGVGGLSLKNIIVGTINIVKINASQNIKSYISPLPESVFIITPGKTNPTPTPIGFTNAKIPVTIILFLYFFNIIKKNYKFLKFYYYFILLCFNFTFF